MSYKFAGLYGTSTRTFKLWQWFLKLNKSHVHIDAMCLHIGVGSHWEIVNKGILETTTLIVVVSKIFKRKSQVFSRNFLYKTMTILLYYYGKKTIGKRMNLKHMDLFLDIVLSPTFFLLKKLFSLIFLNYQNYIIFLHFSKLKG